MPHHNSKELDFKCVECGAEFSKKRGFRKYLKNGEFVCYKTGCVESDCNGVAKTGEDQEEISLSPGAHKTRAPMMKERDFSVRRFCPNDVIDGFDDIDRKSDKHPFKDKEGESDG